MLSVRRVASYVRYLLGRGGDTPSSEEQMTYWFRRKRRLSLAGWYFRAQLVAYILLSGSSGAQMVAYFLSVI